MVDYQFEKDEYCFYASFLIFGEDSPITSTFKYMTMKPFSNIDLKISKAIREESSSFKRETARTIEFSSKVILSSGGTEMSSGINTDIRYVAYGIGNRDTIEVCDTLFKDSEYNKLSGQWQDYYQIKIKYLSVLIKAIHKNTPFDLPRCLIDFPNISTAIFDYVHRAH